jgi:predicted SprT family Zn-dependent metalloprotease
MDYSEHFGSVVIMQFRISLSETRMAAVQQTALVLMARHGLRDWAFRFNRRKKAMGMCFYHQRRIELSIYFVQRNGPEEILDTLLHEIAHALVGPDHAHDAVWKRKCIEIGARPVRCGNANMPEGRWKSRCRSCSRDYHRHRKPKRMKGWFCRFCGPERGGLVWRKERLVQEGPNQGTPP